MTFAHISFCSQMRPRWYGFLSSHLLDKRAHCVCVSARSHSNLFHYYYHFYSYARFLSANTHIAHGESKNRLKIGASSVGRYVGCHRSHRCCRCRHSNYIYGNISECVCSFRRYTTKWHDHPFILYAPFNEHPSVCSPQHQQPKHTHTPLHPKYVCLATAIIGRLAFRTLWGLPVTQNSHVHDTSTSRTRHPTFAFGPRTVRTYTHRAAINARDCCCFFIFIIRVCACVRLSLSQIGVVSRLGNLFVHRHTSYFVRAIWREQFKL